MTLAAAARSCGRTIAITYELRVGTSICDSALRISSSAITIHSEGMKGMRIRQIEDGMCVNTIVLTSPIFAAMRTATRYESAVSIPVQKKMMPVVCSDMPKF